MVAVDKAAPLFGQCGEQQLDALLERGNIGRWAVHKGTEVADPDKSYSAAASGWWRPR